MGLGATATFEYQKRTVASMISRRTASDTALTASRRVLTCTNAFDLRSAPGRLTSAVDT
jgi:hypothetical protein